MILRTIIYVLFILLLTRCEEEKHDPVFDRLEERVFDNPDSVCTVLEGMNPKQIPGEFDRSRHAMLLMMARHKCSQNLQPDSNLYKATEYFHKKKDLLNEAKARYYAGVAECEVGNNQAAIRETLHAIDRSHEAADTFWMGRAHDLAHEIYLDTYDCKNAAIEADKAAVYFKRAGATAFHRYALLGKAQALNYPVYEDGTPIGRGMALLDSLKKVALNDGDSSLVAGCLNSIAFYNFKAKNYKLATAQIDSICVFSDNPYYINSLFPDIINMRIDQGLSPVHLLKQYKNTLKSSNDTISYLSIEKKYATITRNWELAYNLLDSIQTYYDIILADKTYNSIDEIKEKYNKAVIAEKQKENLLLKSTRTHLYFIIIGGMLFFIILFILSRLRNKHKENTIMGRLFEMATENEGLKTQIKYQELIVAENKLLKEKVQEQDKVIFQKEALEMKREEYEKVISENLHLKEQLQSQESDFKQKLKDKEVDSVTNVITLSQKQSSLFGNRIDTLCNLAMEYYGDKDNKAFKNEIYHRVLEELQELKSEKFLKSLEKKINDIYNNILTRLQDQLPEIAKGNIRWIALMIGGVQPRTISFLLDIKIQTLYSKRLRIRAYIEKSMAPDKKEFLLFLPKAKE